MLHKSCKNNISVSLSVSATWRGAGKVYLFRAIPAKKSTRQNPIFWFNPIFRFNPIYENPMIYFFHSSTNRRGKRRSYVARDTWIDRWAHHPRVYVTTIDCGLFVPLKFRHKCGGRRCVCMCERYVLRQANDKTRHRSSPHSRLPEKPGTPTPVQPTLGYHIDPSWTPNKVRRLLQGLPPSQVLGDFNTDVVHKHILR